MRCGGQQEMGHDYHREREDWRTSDRSSAEMNPVTSLLLRLLLLLMMMMMTMTRGHTEDINSVHWSWDRQPLSVKKPRTLNIGGIFPMSGAWAGGRGCRPAVDIALKDINRRTDLLPQFTLQMLANDSQVYANVVYTNDHWNNYCRTLLINR